MTAFLERHRSDWAVALDRMRHRRWDGNARQVGSWLNAHEERVFSQFGEDGIIKELFSRIGVTEMRFVEIGASDGQQNNTRRLLERGWSGLWIEGDRQAANDARDAFAHFPVTVVHAIVTAESIGDALQSAHCPAEFDLLSLDVDGNDYYIWRALGRKWRPRVVVVEYNASAPPGVHWVQPYLPHRFWDGTRRFGASVAALHELATTLGYALVACESQGANAFFVRGDVLDDRLPGTETRAYRLYESPKYGGERFGHPCAIPDYEVPSPQP